jgi:hypothetical protein
MQYVDSQNFVSDYTDNNTVDFRHFDSDYIDYYNRFGTFGSVMFTQWV